MAKNRSVRIAVGAGLLALVVGIVAFNAIMVVGIVAFNAINLTEAFGNGPLYYGRTTNIDKWSNPLPVLAGVDAVGVLAIAGYVYLLRRGR